MTISLVDTQVATGVINAGDITRSFTALENDIVVAMFHQSRAAGGTPAEPGDYNDIYKSFTGAPCLYVGWKRMGSSPDTDVTFTGGHGSSDSTGLAVYVFRGVTTTDADVLDGVTPTTAASTNPAAIIPATTGAWVIDVVASAARDTSPGGNDGTNDTYSNSGNDTYDSTLVASTYENCTGSQQVDPGAFSSLTSTTPLSVTFCLSPSLLITSDVVQVEETQTAQTHIRWKRREVRPPGLPSWM